MVNSKEGKSDNILIKDIYNQEIKTKSDLELVKLLNKGMAKYRKRPELMENYRNQFKIGSVWDLTCNALRTAPMKMKSSIAWNYYISRLNPSAHSAQNILYLDDDINNAEYQSLPEGYYGPNLNDRFDQKELCLKTKESSFDCQSRKTPVLTSDFNVDYNFSKFPAVRK